VPGLWSSCAALINPTLHFRQRQDTALLPTKHDQPELFDVMVSRATRHVVACCQRNAAGAWHSAHLSRT